MEMLKLMRVGEKVTAWVPSELAYGPNGNRTIPGNSVLKFEIELLDVISDSTPKEVPKPQKTIKE